VEAGGGNAQMQLEYSTELAKMGLIDSPPLHHKFGIADARIVAPGHPERSVLFHRLSHRGEGTGQMPQLASHLVDEQAVKMFESGSRRSNRPRQKRSKTEARLPLHDGEPVACVCIPANAILWGNDYS
jgi:hypothetical protein